MSFRVERFIAIAANICKSPLDGLHRATCLLLNAASARLFPAEACLGPSIALSRLSRKMLILSPPSNLDLSCPVDLERSAPLLKQGSCRCFRFGNSRQWARKSHISDLGVSAGSARVSIQQQTCAGVGRQRRFKKAIQPSSC